MGNWKQCKGLFLGHGKLKHGGYKIWHNLIYPLKAQMYTQHLRFVNDIHTAVGIPNTLDLVGGRCLGREVSCGI